MGNIHIPSTTHFGSRSIHFEEVEPRVADVDVAVNEAKLLLMGEKAQAEVAIHGRLIGCTAVGGYILGAKRIIGVSHISPGVERPDSYHRNSESQSIQFMRMFAEIAKNDTRLEEAQLVIMTRATEPASVELHREAFASEVDTAVAGLSDLPNLQVTHTTYPLIEEGYSFGAAIIHGAGHIVIEPGSYTSQLQA